LFKSFRQFLLQYYSHSSLITQKYLTLHLSPRSQFMTIHLSRAIINEIIPQNTLNDLSGESEIANDLDYLLNWLQPYFPPEMTANRLQAGNDFIEPSQRIKAAIRSCLNHDGNQLELIKLYINSINYKFKEFFQSFNSNLFLDYYQVIKSITTYYTNHINYLNLNPLAKDLFRRNLNSLFHTCLITLNDSFLSSLEEFLNDFLFKKSRKNRSFNRNGSILSGSRDSISQDLELDTNEMLTTLFNINLNNEINHILIKLSIQKIKKYILTHCSNIWNQPLLNHINQFIQNEIYPNFSILKDSSDVNTLYELLKIAHDELVSVRINEIFHMILDYPNSYHSLNELHHCLLIKYNHHHYNEKNFQSSNLSYKDSSLTNFAHLANYSLKSQSYQRTKLVETFIQCCHNNLLHSGVNTVDVITTYTKTIKSFLIIDPKGVLLDKVVRPIRMYLKSREDIIIKLVHGLLDDEQHNDLYELAYELRNSEKTKSDKSNIILEDSLDLDWIPDPIDALPDFKKDKVSDLIESLISIFDSKEIFIDEFTKLFGDRLLELTDYNVKEIQDHLDLLKLRFGNQEFTVLDIMIRDVHDSRTTNQEINTEIKDTKMTTPGITDIPISGEFASKEIISDSLNFHTTILSHIYWPMVIDKLAMGNDNFKVPTEILHHFEKYNESYSKIKKGRTVKFVPTMGTVKLDLEFKKKTMSFEVTPDKAAVISVFNGVDNELSVDFIANKLSMTSYMVSNCLSYWVQQKVLIELTKSIYIVDDDEDEFATPFQ
jgi:anaphase-promoting complex subunit 2